MRSFIIASHGHFASGLAHTIELVSNKKEMFHVLDAYSENIPVADEVAAVMAEIDPDDELVILTDLLGGSVNQEFALVAQRRPNTTVIAGANVALALQLALHPERKPPTEERINTYIEQARKAIVHVNQVSTEMDDDDE
ncbi:PTS sugar transporter subunit IIA [Corynebacterium pacaense]|uniref:PTS sugar transporter subunit IIA n=1 Tax=Corynebacterium pacaense TaxID=1816684 RepID=UPI0009BB3C1D|nr:hypothetical protein [Corynebacterium pacaense]